jgi:UDP-N-acetylmuramoylalanine--D-glutamate ligase
MGALALFAPDAWVAGGRLFLQGEPLLPVGDIRLPGVHNLENCLAAGTAAIARGVDREAVAEGLRTFTGVAHRLETAGIIAGVTYVNDSKATNVDATLTALNAYPEGAHLILGGRDKASDYRPIARACSRGCRAVYLIGEAAPLIAQAFSEVRAEEGLAGVPAPRVYGDLENAVRAAAAAAVAGDVVLLAPACASFDQYGDFEERGDHFRSIVAGLAGA